MSSMKKPSAQLCGVGLCTESTSNFPWRPETQGGRGGPAEKHYRERRDERWGRRERLSEEGGGGGGTSARK